MFRSYLDLPRTVHVLSLGMFVNRAGSFVVPFLALYLSESRGFPTTFAASALGMFGVGSVLAAAVGGRLADEVGRRPVMIASLVGAAVWVAILPALEGPEPILAVVFLVALFSESYRPAAQAMISDVTPRAARPRAFALLYVAVNLGFAFGAAVGGRLASWSFAALFWADAATSLVFAIVLVVGVREVRSSTGRRPPRGGRIERAGLPRVRPFAIFLAGTFCISLVFTQAMSTFPLDLGTLGIGPASYGQIMAVNGVLIAAGQLPLAHVVSGWDRGATLAASGVILGAGFALHGAVEAPLAFAGAVAVWTLGEMLHACLAAPAVDDLAPEHLRGRAYGAFSMTFGAALMVGPPLGGLALEGIGSTGLWLSCGLLGVLAGALMLSIRGELRSSGRLPEAREVGPAPAGSS